MSGKSVTGPNPRRCVGQYGAMTSRTYPGGNTAALAAGAGAKPVPVPARARLDRECTVRMPPRCARSRSRWRAITLRAGGDARDRQVMEFLRRRIKTRYLRDQENRTFDQVWRLTKGARADPALAQFGAALTPNSHHLATQFVTLDNFMAPGDGSMDGWSWALQGRVTTTEAITQQINYAAVNRGLSYETEGANRNVPVNFPTVAERDAARGGGRRLQQGPGGLPRDVNLLTARASASPTRRSSRGRLHLQACRGRVRA